MNDIMNKPSPKRRVLTALFGGVVDKTPVTSIGACGGTVTVEMQNAIGVHWPEAHKDPEKMAKLAIASYNLTGIENVRVPFDFVVEAEALGCEIKWVDKPDAVPSVSKHPFKSPADLKKPDNLLSAGRIPVVLESIKLLREEVGDYLPITSTVVGPLSLGGYLVGITNLLMWLIRKPDYVKQLVDFTTDIVLEFSKAQYRWGADIVQVAEPTASLSMISPPMFREYAQPALTKISDNLGGLKVLHICGRTLQIVSDMAKTGFDGLSLEEDIAQVKQLCGDVKVLGNISSSKTLIFGSPDEVKVEAKKALEAKVDLLEPNCGISPITPLANIKAMVEARDEFFADKSV